MEPNAVYVKVGLFVLVFFALLVGAVILLGGAEMSDDSFLVETYLAESVTGLDVGAAVKLRGVPIGSVEEIGFTRTIYRTELSYIRIVMKVRPLETDVGQEEDLDARIKAAVERGLRVRIASGGLTGAMYMEVDFLGKLERDWPEPIEVTWTPKNRYLPAAPSTMERLQKGLDEILADFDGMDLSGTMKEIKGLVVDLRKSLGDNLDPIAKNLGDTTAKLPGAIDDLTKWVTVDLKGDVDRMADSLTGVVDNDIKDLIASLKSDVDTLTESIDKLAKHLDESMTRDVDPALANVAKASEALPEIMNDIRSSLRRIDRLTGSQASQIEGVLTNVRVLSGNVRELIELIKRQPSGAIFGGPPPRVRKGGK